MYDSEKHYYVYAYLRSKDSEHGKAGTPYYIGKGYRLRAHDKAHSIAVPKEPSRIGFIATGLREADAFQLEMNLEPVS